MNIYGIIYKVTNVINGKVYIGQTTHTLARRKTQHLNAMKRKSYKLYQALLKHGPANFIWSKLDSAYNKEALNEKEIYYINEYNSFNKGYNMTEGGTNSIGAVGELNAMYGLKGSDHPAYGNILSEEARQKISASKKARKHTESAKRKMSETRKNSGMYVGANNPNYGKPRHNETKSKIATTLKGRFIGALNPNAKKYSIETPTGEIILIDCLASFCREHKLNPAHMVSCAKGNRNQHKNYKCSYLED